MKQLPAFPVFTDLDIDHRAAIKDVTVRFPNYSDFNFASLFTWNVQENAAISSLHGNLIIKFCDYINGRPFLSLLGTNKLSETMEELFEYCHRHMTASSLRLVPQSVVDALTDDEKAHLEIVEDRDGHDYILSVQELCEFKTSHFKRRKERHNRFMRQHGHTATYRLLNLTSPEIREKMAGVLESWRESRGKSNEDVKTEAKAIKRGLQYGEEMGLQACGIYIEGELVAFNLFEIISNMALGHFIKADVRYEGIFEHLIHSFAKYLQSIGVEYINVEQDAGIEGLRKYKESYRPVSFLRKYTVSQKS